MLCFSMGSCEAGVPLFSFGVIADVQYADIDDKLNFNKTQWRHYRQALTNLKLAIQGKNLHYRQALTYLKLAIKGKNLDYRRHSLT